MLQSLQKHFWSLLDVELGVVLGQVVTKSLEQTRQVKGRFQGLGKVESFKTTNKGLARGLAR